MFLFIGKTVIEVGSIVKDKFDWFSGSADGLIMNEIDGLENYGLLEIKCIYSCRDGLIEGRVSTVVKLRA